MVSPYILSEQVPEWGKYHADTKWWSEGARKTLLSCPCPERPLHPWSHIKRNTLWEWEVCWSTGSAVSGWWSQSVRYGKLQNAQDAALTLEEFSIYLLKGCSETFLWFLPQPMILGIWGLPNYEQVINENNDKELRAGGMAHAVERLRSKCKTLSSNPSASKGKKKQKHLNFMWYMILFWLSLETFNLLYNSFFLKKDKMQVNRFQFCVFPFLTLKQYK
jgi:hypothetical protein